jgi:hypothetical protein
MNQAMNQQKVFTDIYSSNSWGSSESVSGRGSEVINTEALIKQLPHIFGKYNIRSISDCPCGDYNWMRYVDKFNIESYTGYDIVDELIKRNSERFPNVTFKHLDITTEILPKSDLIICRDLLFHLPINQIHIILDNFRKSGSSYLLVTNHMDNTIVNFDIQVGFYRKINLRKFPFNLKAPLEIIIDENFEHNNRDKAMCLWQLL